MIKLRRAGLKDYMEIELHNYQKGFTKVDVEHYYFRTNMLGEPKTATRDGEIVGIADIVDMGDNYLAWCLLSAKIKSSTGLAKDLYRVLKRTLELYKDKPIHAHVLAFDLQAVNMIKHLGFTKKEFLPEYYNGDDFWLYEKVQ